MASTGGRRPTFTDGHTGESRASPPYPVEIFGRYPAPRPGGHPNGLATRYPLLATFARGAIISSTNGASKSDSSTPTDVTNPSARSAG